MTPSDQIPEGEKGLVHPGLEASADAACVASATTLVPGKDITFADLLVEPPPPVDDLAGMENGPALWSAILARMPEGAIVAGGAVRDYLLGVPPKDIDVFFNVSKFHTKTDWMGFGSLGTDRAAEYEAMNAIAVVQRATLGRLQVDAIALSLPTAEGADPFLTPFSGPEVVATFDFGLTRCWYDGEIHDTPEALWDRTHKTVTLLLTDRLTRAAERFARFNARMGGDWTCRMVSDGAGNGTASGSGDGLASGRNPQ